MAPRGLKAALKKAPVKLVGRGVRRGFALGDGTKLRGLTKRLQHKIFSKGSVPLSLCRGEPRSGKHWQGPDGGRRRGTRVDAQLTRIVNSGGKKAKKDGYRYVLTRLALSALEARGLEPILAQRGVCSVKHRVATAADLVCFEKDTDKLVVVEIKTGFSHGREESAQVDGNACKLQPPLHKAADTSLHRHLAQLAVTRELLVREKKVMVRIAELGVDGVDAVLLYLDNDEACFYDLDSWWRDRASKILDRLA